MNRRLIIYSIGILTALIVGFLAGTYVTAIAFRYREVFFAVSGGLFRLYALDRGSVDQVRQEAGLSTIVGCALFDRFPAWARQYSPATSTGPWPAQDIEEWLDSVHKLADSESNRSYMSNYHLSTYDLERILRSHLPHLGYANNKQSDRSTEPPRSVEPSSAGALAKAEDATRAVCESDDAGRRTVTMYQPNKDHGVFETKVLTLNGEIEQWYQYWVDSDGKVLIEVLREPGSNGIPAHAGIRLIAHYLYRPDGNVSEKHQYFGDGRLRRKEVYVYGENGEYMYGEMFDARGRRIARVSKPEARMYGEKWKKTEPSGGPNR